MIQDSAHEAFTEENSFFEKGSIKQISCGIVFSGEEQNFQKNVLETKIFTENFVPLKTELNSK